MSFIRDTRSVEQQHFFDGQRLFADDLQGIEAFNREMRWLHNQSLHQPGIGNGFAVSGKKGDREVTVGPGYAIDDLGREIVLTRDRTLPVPPVAGDGGLARRYLLTVAYPDDADLEIVEQRQGICADPGATRLRVEPVFCWQPLNPDGTPKSGADAILRGRELTLAEIAVKDCKLDRDISIVTRRNAKPVTQPYIFAGEQIPTDWQPWIEPTDDGEEDDGPAIMAASSTSRLYGFEAWIDTSVAGFLSRPEYFCRINGDRVFAVELFGAGEYALLMLDGLVHIADATADGFMARVILIPLGVISRQVADTNEYVQIAKQKGSVLTTDPVTGVVGYDLDPYWTVVWMGVEG
jgi:hypothetical protein